MSLDVQTQVEGLALNFKEIWTGLDCLGQRQVVNKRRLDKCAEGNDTYCVGDSNENLTCLLIY
jgi:hypothetical protein